ncbi:MAG: HEAT repeat domain-containing protein [Scytolyngbya sp. HA4215-MV1]|nr:HEAT repeat domain-containing protein [Scytolyngbya sp. HA4215-MV1]
MRLNQEAIDDLLFEGQLLLLLDGVNELPSGVLGVVEAFRKDNDRCPMIFTTRALDVGAGLGIAQKLEMCALTELQMREFIQKRLPGQADTLLRQLKDRLRELAETPLLLKILCDVFAADGQIPQSRGELFRKQFAQKYAEFKRLPELVGDSSGLLPQLLQTLAFEMMQGTQPTQLVLQLSKAKAAEKIQQFLQTDREKANDYLQALVKYHLLQQSTNPNQIEFCHQLFQEYYAAESLLTQLFQLSDAQLQRNYLNLLKWTEPLAMMTALVKDDIQVVRIIRLALEVDFYLGGRLAGEAQISLQKATIDLLIQENFTQSLTIWLLEQTYSSCALPFLLDVLQNGSADNRWRAARALGNYSSTAVLEQLIGALQDPDSSVRYQAAKSLGKSGCVEAIPYLDQLLSDDENEENWLVRSVAVEALGEIKNTESTKCLKKALRNKDSTVRNKAAQYLGQRIPEDVVTLLSEEFFRDNSDSKSDVLTLLKETKNVAALPTLIHALSDDDWITRSHAALQIGSLGIWLDRNSLEEALIALIYTLQSDPDISVRSTAALSLGFIGNSQVVPLLIDALSQEEEIVRSSAINALEKLQDRTAIPALIRALQDNSYVCEAAIKALRTLNAVEALSQIRKLKHHKVADIRQEVILTLGFIGDSKDFPYLYQALNEREKFSTRLCAAYSLSNLNNRKGVKILENALRDGNEEARKLAILGLKNFQGKVGISSIFSNLLKESEYSLQKLSLDFLEPFKETSEIIDQLKIALDSSNEDICRNAMDTAKVLGNAEHLLCLRQLAATITVVERPLEAIAAIQANCQFYNYEIFQEQEAERQESRGRSQESGVGSQEGTTNVYIEKIERVGNFNTGDVTIHGNQIGDNSNL